MLDLALCQFRDGCIVLDGLSKAGRPVDELQMVQALWVVKELCVSWLTKVFEVREVREEGRVVEDGLLC